MRQNSIAFGNFICRFGNDIVLLDRAEEIVVPAFTDSSLKRHYSTTTYFLLDTTVENVGTDSEPRIAIAGRFVKDTTLLRQQVYSPETGLRADPITIPSSPSAFFVLLLENHRLIYLAETHDAPDMKTFSLTMRDFISEKYEQHIRNLKEENKAKGRRVKLQDLRNELPHPTLEIVPLPSNLSLATFIRRYKKLQSISIRLIKPNDEFDAASMIRAVRESTARIDSKITTIQHRNPDGLNRTASVNELTEASKTGNQIVNLSGIDKDDNRLKGNNESFQLSAMMDSVPENRTSLIRALVKNFDSQVRSRAITIGQTTRDIAATMKRLAKSLLS